MGIEHSRRSHDAKRWVADRLPVSVSKKWEAHSRRKSIDRLGWTPLSDLSSFNVNETHPNEVSLHVHENLTRSPLEANMQLLEGLKVLAKRLKTDESLAHVTQVAGHSWLVYDSPTILEMLGFTVSERDDKQEKALATMPREKFIQRFARE